MLDVLVQVTPHSGPVLPGGAFAGQSAKTVVWTVAAAVIYGAVGYVKNRRRRGESFDLEKVLATVVVAIGVAALNLMLGNALTANTVTGQLALYGGQIVAVEKTLESLIPNTFPGASDSRDT